MTDSAWEVCSTVAKHDSKQDTVFDARLNPITVGGSGGKVSRVSSQQHFLIQATSTHQSTSILGDTLQLPCHTCTIRKPKCLLRHPLIPQLSDSRAA